MGAEEIEQRRRERHERLAQGVDVPHGIGRVIDEQIRARARREPDVIEGEVSDGERPSA